MAGYTSDSSASDHCRAPFWWELPTWRPLSGAIHSLLARAGLVETFAGSIPGILESYGSASSRASRYLALAYMERSGGSARGGWNKRLSPGEKTCQVFA